MRSRLAKLTLNTIIDTPRKGIWNRLKVLGAARLRAALVRLGDPLVEYCLDGTPIALPLSHDLPLYRRSFPHYAANIGRVAWLVRQKYSDLRVIDIGANVGDTAAILRVAGPLSVLCIEGEGRYAAILASNAARLGHLIVIERCFVGASAGSMRAEVRSRAGSARLMVSPTAKSAVPIETLSQIIARHPEFAEAKLIKVDTDGMDTAILRSEQSLLARAKPIVFFEYDPFWFQKYGDDGFAVFDALRAIDYVTAVFFDNTGDYLVSASLDDRRLLEDLHAYYLGRAGRAYCDICAFHAEDSDLSAALREREIAIAAVRQAEAEQTRATK